MNVTLDGQQPTWRLWGEEKSDDAVYSVYLKKVRYHNPSKSVNSDSEDEISHLSWETVRVKVLKTGSLEKLVESLGSDNGEIDSTYMNIFLATYRTFTTMDRILTLMLERYLRLENNNPKMKESARHHHKKTLRMTLQVWLDTFPDDFKDPPRYLCLNKILHLCEKTLPQETSELRLKVKHKLDKFCKEEEQKPIPMLKRILSSEEIRCTSPSLTYSRQCHFLDLPNVTCAEQLTRMDCALFRKVIPHQCLGSIWSKRDRSRSGGESSTVIATVEQFNAVSFRVISTIVMEGEMKPGQGHHHRAKVIVKWIEIAQELRLLKNFSTLKAIISGLQSNPVYRLKQTWASIPKEKNELFEELARIFSEENNKINQRELLMKEGTAKYAETAGEHDKQLQKVFSRSNISVSHGTIPYLGTFLTDLTYINEAHPDTIDGLINLDKRRKEFEVLAQIKLLQGAANAYQLQLDADFERWFESVLILDDKEAYELSCQVEPHGSAGSGSSRERIIKKKTGFGHRKNDSIASTSSSSSSQFYFDNDSSGFQSPNDSISLERQMSTSSSSSSLPSLDVSVGSAATNQSGTLPSVASSPGLKSLESPKFVTGSTTSSVTASVSEAITGSDASGLSSPASPYMTSDFYIIRVTIRSHTHETDGVNLYKSIMLTNNERTPQVIKNAMEKHDIEGNADDYQLAQILPDSEMVLPPNGNVYYAINTSHPLNFVLKPKKDSSLETNKDPKAKKKLLMLHK